MYDNHPFELSVTSEPSVGLPLDYPPIPRLSGNPCYVDIFMIPHKFKEEEFTVISLLDVLEPPLAMKDWVNKAVKKLVKSAKYPLPL